MIWHPRPPGRNSFRLAGRRGVRFRGALAVADNLPAGGRSTSRGGHDWIQAVEHDGPGAAFEGLPGGCRSMVEGPYAITSRGET
jgi:hypothetical protein